ncbi:MAG TPA: flagellar motor stator protein MotA [Nitrococcus sp.]|nr:flagellar motor stator protein MotA [Nitrococcus sp.]
MLILLGYLMVIGSIVGGFLLGGGHLGVLFQPVELLIIGGAACAAFVISSGSETLKATAVALAGAMRGSPYNKALYMETLTMISELAAKARLEGLLAIEADVENPGDSPIFQKARRVSANRHAMEFLTDYLRIITSGQISAHDMDNLLDLEIETHHHETMRPVDALRKMADGLPAFGIVAAVLGVVHTMQSVDQPPAVLGKLIAAALVGTFLGILLGYGFVAPVANLLEQRAAAAGKYLECLKAGLMALVTGAPPATAVEYARKVIYSNLRPGFLELEEHLRQQKNG